MKLLSVLLAAAFSAAAPAAPPQADAGIEALADTLLSVLPDRAEIDRVQAVDPDRLAFLTGINPGKAPQVKAILEDFQVCIAPASAEGVRTMVRKAARTIGAVKVQRMIDFYRSDPAVMRGLIERLRAPAPSAADQAEKARLFAAFPLEEYAKAFERAKAEAEAGGDSAFVAAAMRCVEAEKAALDRARLNSEPPSTPAGR